MGDGLPADERDVAFIPGLCDQLDDVYRRYLNANRAEIDEDTRHALERSLQLLVAAQAGVREVWLQTRVGRAVRQTNEILATYSTPEALGEVTGETSGGPIQPISELAERPALGGRRRLRILVTALVVALAGAVTAAAVFHAQLDSARHDQHGAEQQALAAKQGVASLQTTLASATRGASGTRVQLSQAQAQLTRLQAELSRAQAQMSTTTTTRPPPSTSPAVQQSLAAAESQVQHLNAVVRALVVCANDDSVVINDELGGFSVAASQALQVANAVCQSASSGA